MVKIECKIKAIELI